MRDHLLKEAVCLIYHVINQTRVHAKKATKKMKKDNQILFAVELKAKNELRPLKFLN